VTLTRANVARSATRPGARSGKFTCALHPCSRACQLLIAEQQAEDLAFSEVILSPGLGSELFRQETQRALTAMRALVRRAMDSGALRADFHESDLLMLQYANAGVIRAAQRSAPTAWKRLTEYMLQSFRTPGTSLQPPSSTWVRLSGQPTPGTGTEDEPVQPITPTQ